MREMTSPSLITPESVVSIPRLLADRVAREPAGTYLELKAGLGGTWTPMSIQTFADDVTTVAKGLVAFGIEPGDRVSIMSRTRYEWTLLDFAIWAAGAVPVPVYETSSADQVQWILSDAGVRLAIVESQAHATLTESVRDQLPDLGRVLVINDGAIQELTQEGRGVGDAEIERRSALATPDDLATIIYTSGTTGRPKGAELTHGNFVMLSLEGQRGLYDVCAAPGSRTLLFMPLAHVFARFIEVLCIATGAVIGHTPDTKNLLADLGTFKPTFILSVPRVFEKVYNSAEQKAGGGTKLKLFRWAAKTSIVYSRALDTTEGPNAALKAQHALADRLVLHKLRTALGGQAKYAISGGAPLGERLGHFYRGVGLRVLEGYGLTETTAPTAVNRPAAVRIGTVGPPMPGTSIRIADDGEIQVKGDHVFRGYYNNPAATAEAFDDGWFRTGDLGSRWTTTATCGSPAARRRSSSPRAARTSPPPCSRTACAATRWSARSSWWATRSPFIGALVTLDPEMLPGWLAGHGLPAMDVTSAPPRATRCSPRSTAPSSGPTRRSRAPSRSASSPC